MSDAESSTEDIENDSDLEVNKFNIWMFNRRDYELTIVIWEDQCSLVWETS
jgi:hypothetical protein